MLIKNDHYTVTIAKQAHTGDGIAYLDDSPIYIPNTLPGDTCRVHMLKVTSKRAFAKVLELIEPSPDRIEPLCPISAQCGGCDLQHQHYESQCKFKEELLRSALHPYKELSSVPIQPIISCEIPYYYRNKAQFAIGEDSSGSPIVGLYAKRSHRIVDIPTCYIQPDPINTALEHFKTYLHTHHPSIYNESTKMGQYRHVIIRSSHANQSLMICVVSSTDRLEDEDAFIQAMRRIPHLSSLLINVNPHDTNTILGPTTHVLWGDDTFTETIGQTQLVVSVDSFLQSNPVQTEVLYQHILKAADVSSDDVVWDLYSGVGSIALYIAPHVKDVIGVECVPSAVENATKNAQQNNLTNTQFLCGNSESIYHDHADHNHQVVILDPPRKGCDPQLLDTLIAAPPKRLVYVSCQPKTLARDLHYLVTHGDFNVHYLQPVDMFPQTAHLETIAVLTA